MTDLSSITISEEISFAKWRLSDGPTEHTFSAILGMWSTSSSSSAGLSVGSILCTFLPLFLHLFVKWFLPPHLLQLCPQARHWPRTKGWFPSREVTRFSIVTCHSFRSDYCNCSGDTFLVFPLFDEHLQPFVRLLLPSVVKLSIRCSGRYLYTCWVFRSCNNHFLVYGLHTPNKILSRMRVSLKHSQKLHVCARVRSVAIHESIDSSGDRFLLLNT